MPEVSAEWKTEELASSMAAHSGKRVAVFCGSAEDVPAVYREEAVRLGELLAHKECALVYGGGSWGLMGSVAKSAHTSGMTAIVSVLPSFMRETCGVCYGHEVLVGSMAERKAVIGDLTDIFIALPGGFGTLDEMTEMLTWNQIGVHNKLVGILNTAGYYDNWLLWIDRAAKDGFIKKPHLQNLIVEDTVQALVERVLSATACSVGAKFFTKA